MTFHEFTFRLEGFLTFLANAIVCVAAVRFYRHRPLRAVLLIAMAAGLGALVTILPWLVKEPDVLSSGFVYLMRLMGIADMVLWAVGSCWLFQAYERQARERGAGN